MELVFTHERIADATCEMGHSFSVSTSEPAYALIFERALQRFVDGDYRDSLLDAYTALDMYTPTVPVRARYDRDASLGPGDIPRLREDLSYPCKDANRALGAALAVVSVVCGEAPPRFRSKLAELRNDAVHAGKYPSAKDARWAIDEVERLITTIDDMLTAAAPNRQPPFSLAVQVVDFPKVGAALLGHVSLGLSTVLSGTVTPRERVEDRIARYRAGELDDVRLY